MLLYQLQLWLWMFYRRWLNEKKHSHCLTKLNISRNTVSWVFENVGIAIVTMVKDDLMTLVK